MKVFIIELNQASLTEVGDLIKSLGGESRGIYRTEDLLPEKIVDFAPDVIIINPALLEKIAASNFKQIIASTRDYPVVFLVDQKKSKLPRRLLTFDICGWVTKPINPLVLRSTIELAVNKYALAKQRAECYAQHNKVMEYIQDVCWITDMSGVIEDVSRSVEHFFDFTREELIGRNIAEFSGVVTDNENIWNTLKKNRHLKDFKVEVKSKNDRLIDCSLTTEVISGQRKVFGILENIHGSRNTEWQLNQILAGVATPIFILNKHHAVTHWNKAIENLTGIPASQMIGTKNAWRAFYADERPLLADLVLDGAADDKIQKYFTRTTHHSLLLPDSYESMGFFEKVGEHKNLWLFINVSKIKDEKGQVIGAIETLKDISETVRIDQALKESESIFRSFFDQSSNGLVLINQRGEFVEWNKAQERIFGFKRSEVIGKKMAVLNRYISRTSLIKTDLLDKILEVVDYFLKSRETIITNRVIEGEAYLKDGQKKFFQATVFPIRLDEGTLVAISVHDMTRYKQIESTRQSIEEQLRQQKRLESIGTLASGVAHEINNPLTGIINYAQLIYDRVDDQNLQEFSHGIIEEGERVAGIVRNLLAFARQDKEGRSSARIQDIIRVSLALIETVIRKDMITIKEDVPDNLPFVYCMTQQIEQVIINLLMNARDALNMKYKDYHEEKIIEIKAYTGNQDGAYMLITEITDYGIGIPPDIVNSIFDPFFTTKSRSEGTGLGLSVSYGIIKEHGGEINVESVEGKYTKFSFSLPVEEITVN